MTIPTHDHPGMTVCSKVLYGKVHTIGYDIVGEPMSSSETLRTKKVVDEVVVEGSVFSLHPESGNIHSFRALESCAILDVLAPPYAPYEGRECTYYKEVALEPPPVDADGLVFLQPMQTPRDFIVRETEYLGEEIDS